MSHARPFRSVATLALLLAAPLAALARAGAGTADEVPFEKFGRAFLDSHKVKDAASLPMETLLADAYVHGGFGLFDVYYPAATLADKPRFEDLRNQCAALVLLQQRWIDWLALPGAEREPATKAAAELSSWVKSWKASALAQSARAEKKDLYVLEGANEAQLAAQQHFAEYLSKPEALGAAPREIKRMSLVFAPTRRDFVEMIGYAGLLDPTQQAVLWKDGSSGWTSFWIGWNFVLALEYPAWNQDPEFHTGLSMNQFEATGMQQHTLQNAANALQWLCYGEDDATYLHQAVAMNLAIAVCGELNTLEGDAVRGTTGAATQPYEKFVPGGNPAGGTLPPIPAAGGDMLKEGHWRKGHGKDHFVGPLRDGQKDGAKAVAKEKPDKLDPVVAKDKDAHFLLVGGADGSKRHPVSAPFFGKAAMAKVYPPQEVLLDYREFFRAYKSCFFDWMQRAGDKGNAETSATKFRELLRKLADKPEEQTFEALVQEIYGVPLSAANGETDSLEWRFLGWLGKGGK